MGTNIHSSDNLHALLLSPNVAHFPVQLRSAIKWIIHLKLSYNQWYQIHHRDNSAKWLTMGWTTGVQFPAHTMIFIFATMFRPALQATKPPIQWVMGHPSLGVKWTEHETPSTAMKLYLQSSIYIFMAECLSTGTFYFHMYHKTI